MLATSGGQGGSLFSLSHVPVGVSCQFLFGALCMQQLWPSQRLPLSSFQWKTKRNCLRSFSGLRCGISFRISEGWKVTRRNPVKIWTSFKTQTG